MTIKRSFMFYLACPTLIFLAVFYMLGMVATEFWNDIVEEGNKLKVLPNIAKGIGEFGDGLGISVLGIFLAVGVIIGLIITVLIFIGFLGNKLKMYDDRDYSENMNHLFYS